MLLRLEDPDLGGMDWNNDRYAKEWTLERRALFNGVSLQVRIEPKFNTQAIDPIQIAATKIALALPSDSLSKSAPAVLQNYEACESLLEEEKLLEIHKPIDIWKYIILESIVVPPHESEGVSTPSFMMYGECSWDPEHGLEIRFRDGYADESNQQGHIGI